MQLDQSSLPSGDCYSSEWRFWQSACYSKRPTEGNVKLSWMNNVCKDIPEWHIIFKLAEMWWSKPNHSPNHTQALKQTNPRQHCCCKDMRMSETLLWIGHIAPLINSFWIYFSSYYSQKSPNIFTLCKKCRFLNSFSLFDIKPPAAYFFIPPAALISTSIGSSGVELLLYHLDISHLHIHMDFYYLDNSNTFWLLLLYYVVVKSLVIARCCWCCSN